MQTLPIPELTFRTLGRKRCSPGGSSAGPAERGVKTAPKRANPKSHSHFIPLPTFSCHPAPFTCPKRSLGRAMWGLLLLGCSQWVLLLRACCRISWQGCSGSAAPSALWIYFPGCSWHPCWTQLWKIFFSPSLSVSLLLCARLICERLTMRGTTRKILRNLPVTNSLSVSLL